MTRSGLLFQNNTVTAAWRSPEESKDRRREAVQKLLSVQVEGMAGLGMGNVVELSDILGGNQQYLGWVDLRQKGGDPKTDSEISVPDDCSVPRRGAPYQLRFGETSVAQHGVCRVRGALKRPGGMSGGALEMQAGLRSEETLGLECT